MENSTDRKSRFLNILVARKVKANFNIYLEKATFLLLEKEGNNSFNYFTQKWKEILVRKNQQEILTILVSKGDYFASLRQTSPFFFALAVKERTLRLKKWEKMRDKRTN